ncbi:MAG: GTP cyclohydrolase II RibA [Lautropia sp.]|nr:GTP cyclohydrolase II RibA [Lautropia sp.]
MRVHPPSSSDLPARRALVQVDRTLTEMRHGRPVIIRAADGRDWLYAAVETLSMPSWQALSSLGGGWKLCVSVQRATVMGLSLAADDDPAGIDVPGTEQPFVRVLSGEVPLAALWQQAGLDLSQSAEAGGDGLVPVQDEAAEAALALARHGRLAPAVVGRPLPPVDTPGGRAPADGADEIGLDALLRVEAAVVMEHARARPVLLDRVAEAPVPLADDADSRFVVFREPGSDFEHVAVIVGKPELDGDEPVPVRLHSSCLTGDLFGSLRCDCGDQLRGTVARLARRGGGIVLYLSQEGRGIGLINKLRAYVRQDQGLDTLDANHSLGFRMDERHFAVAAGMLRQLGCRRILLLTNNPAKIAALAQAGIEVLDREAVLGSVNPHNQRYLATKLRRGGHLFDEDELGAS